MKKPIKIFTRLFVAAVLATGVTACYDDDDIWDKVDELDTRLTALEQAVNNANANITTLQQLVDALQNNVYVTDVTNTTDGYKITFSNGTNAEIRNGVDGTNPPRHICQTTHRRQLVLDSRQ